MFFLLLSALLNPSAQASAAPECSPCKGYGSPFGPGYSYFCYFVKQGDKTVNAYRFGEDELTECRQARAANPSCAQSNENDIAPPRSGDPCWRM